MARHSQQCTSQCRLTVPTHTFVRQQASQGGAGMLHPTLCDNMAISCRPFYYGHPPQYSCLSAGTPSLQHPLQIIYEPPVRA